MNTMPDLLSEAFTTDVVFERPQFDAEPSNIISLAQEGLLLPGSIRLAGDFMYHDYSPLNEW